MSNNDSQKKINKVYKKLLGDNLTLADLKKVLTKKEAVFTSEPEDGVVTLFKLMDKYNSDEKIVSECATMLYKLSINSQINQIIRNVIESQKTNGVKCILNAFEIADCTHITSKLLIKLLENNPSIWINDIFLNSGIADKIFVIMRRRNTSREAQTSCFKLLYELSKSALFSGKVSPDNMKLMIFTINNYNRNTDILFHSVDIFSALAHTELKQEMAGKMCLTVMNAVEMSQSTERSQEFIERALKFIIDVSNSTREAFVVERKAFKIFLNALKQLMECPVETCILIFDALKACGEANALSHSDILGSHAEEIVGIIVRYMRGFSSDFHVQEKGFEALSYYFKNFETCKSALQPPSDNFYFVINIFMATGQKSIKIQRCGCDVFVRLSRIGDTTAKLVSEALTYECLITGLEKVSLAEDIEFHSNMYILFGNIFKFKHGDFGRIKTHVIGIVKDNIERCMNSNVMLNASLLHSVIQLFYELFTISTEQDLIDKTADIVINVMNTFARENTIQSAGCVYLSNYITIFGPIFASYTPDVIIMYICNAIVNYPNDPAICIYGCRALYDIQKTIPLSVTTINSCATAMCFVLTNFYKDLPSLDKSSSFLAHLLASETPYTAVVGPLSKSIVDIFIGLSLSSVSPQTIRNLVFILQIVVASNSFYEAPERFARISDILFDLFVMFKDDEPTLISIYFILITIGSASSEGTSSLRALEAKEESLKVLLNSFSKPGTSSEFLKFSYTLLVKSLSTCLISRIVTKQIADIILENINCLDTRMCSIPELYKIISDIFVRFCNMPDIIAFATKQDFLRIIYDHTEKGSSVEITRTASRIFSLQFFLKDYELNAANQTGALMHFMKNFPSDETIQMTCLSALANIAPFYTSAEAVKQIFDANEVSNFVSRQMQINRGNNTILELCRKILNFAPTTTKRSLTLGPSPSNSVLENVVRKDSSGGNTLELLLRAVPRSFYETIDDSLKSEVFKNVRQMLKYSRETADYLKEHDLLSNLTISDAIAITVYTYDNGPKAREMNVYRIINKVLSERNTDLVFQVRGYIIRLLSALRKLPLFPTNAKLYRGIRGKVSKETKTVGSILAWPAFTSTTISIESVESFLASSDEECIDGTNEDGSNNESYIFEITGQFRGYNIKEFSFHPGEDEVLLEPETKFRVNAVTEYPNIPGVTCISVEVLESKPVLKEVTDNFTEMVRQMEPSQSVSSHLSSSNLVLSQSQDGTGEVSMSDNQEIVLDKFYYSTTPEVPFPPMPQNCYQTLKDSLKPVFETKVFEMLGLFKTRIVDDVHAEANEIIQSYNLSIEGAAAIALFTYDDSTSLTPRKLLNDELAALNRGEIQAFQMRSLGYLLHLMSGLYNLQFFSDTDKVYVPVSQSDLPISSENPVFTMSTFTTAYPNESSARKACQASGNSILLEISNYVYYYNIAPFSLTDSQKSILLIPGMHLCVTNISPTEGNLTKISACALTQDISSEASQACPWIQYAIQAVEQFKASTPLPENWICTGQMTNYQNTFYYNVETAESQIEKPHLIDSNFFSATFDHGFKVATAETFNKLWKMNFDYVTKKVFYVNSLTNERLQQIPDFN